MSGLFQNSFNLVSRYFLNLAHLAVHDDLLAEREVRYRARILIAFSYSFLVLFSLILAVLFFSPVTPETKYACAILWFFIACMLVGVNFLLQKAGQFFPAAHLFIFSLSVMILLGIIITGGVIASPATELILFLPLISFYLLGIRTGFFWSTANLIALSGLYILESKGNPMVDFVGGEFTPLISLLVYLIGFLAVFFMIMVYEKTLLDLHKQQQKSESQVRYLATHDQLTGIANRSHFYDVLHSNMLKCKTQKGAQLGLLYMDLVGFKEVNDKYGHHMGDLVLQRIAKSLNENIRRTDLVARHGGDEFVILLKMVKGEDALGVIAEKVMEVVSQPIDLVGAEVKIFPSMGLALYPDHAQNMDEFERCADTAMYEAKSKKRDWKIYNGGFSLTGRGLQASL